MSTKSRAADRELRAKLAKHGAGDSRGACSLLFASHEGSACGPAFFVCQRPGELIVSVSGAHTQSADPIADLLAPGEWGGRLLRSAAA